jgi:alcohol dehydrogenase
MLKMRAAVLREQGIPAPYASSQPLTIEEVTLDPPQFGEVLIKVEMAGLCHSDLSSIEGNRPRKLPSVPGHEAAGIVVEVGPGVIGLVPGDHVISSVVSKCGTCRFCQIGRATLCNSVSDARKNGILATGGSRLHLGNERLYHWSGLSVFAEFAVVAEGSLVKIDKDIPLDDAALVSCAVMTGTGAIFNAAKVTPGSTVGIVGMGGVGMSALLAALASGAERVVAVDINPEKLSIAAALGATDTFHAGHEDVANDILERTNGGCDSVIETAGSIAAFKLAYAISARGGTTVAVGLPHPSAEFNYLQSTLVSDERRIIGSYMGSGDPSRDIPTILDLYRSGKLPFQKLKTRVVGFDDLNEAFDELAQGKALRNMLKPS